MTLQHQDDGTIILRMNLWYTVSSETDTFMTEALTTIETFRLASAPALADRRGSST